MRKHLSWYQTKANPVPASWRKDNPLGQLSSGRTYITNSKMLDVDNKKADLDFERELRKIDGFDFGDD